MPYLLIDNFSSGLDVRKSGYTAPTGTLRALVNAVINDGGEIEKRKAFTKHTALTAYGQQTQYKGRIAGPFEVPGYPDQAFFRHRYDSLPGGDFIAGSGSIAEYIDYGVGFQEFRFWVQKSTASLTVMGALLHGASYGEFASKGYVVEKAFTLGNQAYEAQHVSVTFTDGEPTAETVVTANEDRPYQMTLDGRGYVIDGDTLHFSAVDDATDMAGTGSGNLLMSSNGQPIGLALSLGEYFGQVAVFGRRGVQFYSVDADPDNFQYQRTVATSLLAPRTVTGYGDGDLIFVGRSGVRSLQARDSSNLAKITDIGSPIDAYVRDLLRYDPDASEPVISAGSTSLPLSKFFDLALGIVYPMTGELWLFMQDRVLVLARHPASKVLAWSEFELPKPDTANVSDRAGTRKSRWVADAARVGETIVFRNFADEVYVYGGEDGQQYDGSKVTVELPFMDMGSPGHIKTFTGIDLVCEGSWEVEVRVNEDAEWRRIGTIEATTRSHRKIGFNFRGMQIAMRLTSTSEYAAKISQVGLFYERAGEK